jgi:hypothetical protein
MWISVNCCDSDQESSVFSVSCLESIPNEESLYIEGRNSKIAMASSCCRVSALESLIIGGAWLARIPSDIEMTPLPTTVDC